MNNLLQLGFLDRREVDALEADRQTAREKNAKNWRRLGAQLSKLGIAPNVAKRLEHSRYWTKSASFSIDEILDIVTDLTEMNIGVIEFFGREDK